jgi:hypothetical protein
MTGPTLVMMTQRLDRLTRSRIVLVVACLTLTAAWPVPARGDDPFGRRNARGRVRQIAQSSRAAKRRVAAYGRGGPGGGGGSGPPEGTHTQ